MSRASYRNIRILLSLLGLGMFFFSVTVMGWTWHSNRERTLDDVQSDVQTNAKVTAAQIARIFDSVAAVSASVVRDRDLMRCLGRGDIACADRALANAVEGHPQVSSLAIVDVAGVPIAVSVQYTSKHKRFTDQALLQDALASERYLIGTKHTDLATQGRTIPMLRGFKDGSGRVWVLVAAINLAVLERSIFSGDHERDGTLVLFRQDGTVLINKPSWLKITNVGETHFFKSGFQLETSGLSKEVLSPGGAILLGGWNTLEDWPLGIFAAVDETEVRDEWREASWPAIAVTASVVSVSMGLLFFLLWQLRRLELAERRISELATRDPVTGLLNRHALLQVLDESLRDTESIPHALLFLDLDRFKAINDSLGHAAGDAVLVQMAQRLQKLVQPGETLARLGGDEFVLLLPRPDGRDIARARAAEVLGAFVAPFELTTGHFASSTSIGLSFYPEDAEDPETLLRHADIAMYAAKARGRNQYCVYEAALDPHSDAKLELERQLQQALQHNEFRLLFQPQIRLRDNQIVGAEALLRWHKPEDGEVDADHFIALAEETHLIVPIGLWALREACRAARHWQAEAPISVTVNLSPLQLRHADLPRQLAAILEETGLSAARLELEVTESVVVQDVSAILTTLQGLDALGVQLSIDDFGVGYSQLSYLKRFDFDKIQIARSFVQDIAEDANDAAIVRAIIGLGHSLDIAVSAKGLSNQAQLDFLRAAGADVVQGYFCGVPVTEDEFLALLQFNARGQP